MDNNPYTVNVNLNVDKNKKSGYSKASFILSVVPLAFLLLVFIISFIISGGGASDNDRGAIWWLFIAAIFIFIPAAAIANILSVIFGIKGLKNKKTVFAWAGIAIVALELLAVLLLFVFWV